jgi:hypothetical protein
MPPVILKILYKLLLRTCLQIMQIFLKAARRCFQAYFLVTFRSEKTASAVIKQFTKATTTHLSRLPKASMDDKFSPLCPIISLYPFSLWSFRFFCVLFLLHFIFVLLQMRKQAKNTFFASKRIKFRFRFASFRFEVKILAVFRFFFVLFSLRSIFVSLQISKFRIDGNKRKKALFLDFVSVSLHFASKRKWRRTLYGYQWLSKKLFLMIALAAYRKISRN